MKPYKSLLLVTAAAALAPSVFATTFVGGELGYIDAPVRGNATRDQVQAEYQRFRQHPVLADGTVVLQGEAAYVSPVQGQSADADSGRPGTHAMGGNAGPAVRAVPSTMTEAERRAYREQYVN